jgi:formyl-CoA transferase
MGRPELADDERYRDHAARGVNQIQLDATIGGWTVEHDIETLLPLLEDAGLAVGRVYRAPDMLKDPQFIASRSPIRRSIVDTSPGSSGVRPSVKMQNAFPLLLPDCRRRRARCAGAGPTLGEHTDAVLREVAGLSG